MLCSFSSQSFHLGYLSFNGIMKNAIGFFYVGYYLYEYAGLKFHHRLFFLFEVFTSLKAQAHDPLLKVSTVVLVLRTFVSLKIHDLD